MSGGPFAFMPFLLFSTRTPATPQTGDVLSVMPFLSLARELAALLIPLRPAEQYRDDLERSLILAARQQHTLAALAGYDQFASMPAGREGFERRWVIGAAAAAAVGSAVSIVGILAYVLRHRSEGAA